MPAYGAAAASSCWGRASLEHGTDDEPAQGGYEGHGDAVPVVVAGGSACDDATDAANDQPEPALQHRGENWGQLVDCLATLTPDQATDDRYD
jgi:hypothetical protein